MIRTLAVALSLAALLVLPASGAETHRGGGLIRIFAVTQNAKEVDVGKHGPSAGDQRLAGMILYDRYNRVIGNAYRICTSMDDVLPNTVSMCQAVYSLPLGKLVVLGTRTRRDYYVLPVIGGTRLYANTQGTLIASTVSFNPRRERLLFSLES